MLTLMGDESTIPWRVLSIDFLVQDKESGGDLLTDKCKFVCCFFFPFLQEVFLWVLQLPWFSPLPKKQLFAGGKKWLILGVKTCEVFLCFLAIVFLGSVVLTSQGLLCIHCFTPLVSFTGFYTEVNPKKS